METEIGTFARPRESIQKKIPASGDQPLSASLRPVAMRAIVHTAHDGVAHRLYTAASDSGQQTSLLCRVAFWCVVLRALHMYWMRSDNAMRIHIAYLFFNRRWCVHVWDGHEPVQSKA